VRCVQVDGEVALVLSGTRSHASPRPLSCSRSCAPTGVFPFPRSRKTALP
jgi:hypothetical protein